MRQLAVAVVALATLWGCTTSDRLPRTIDREAVLPRAESLMRVLAKRRESLRSIRTMARLAYTGPEENRRAKQVILAARPDRLRLEVLSPFGAVFVLTSSEGRLAAYARNEATVYRGSASAENVERYTTVEVPISVALDLLLGTPPMGGPGQLVVSSEDDLIKLWQALPDGGARVTWFAPALDPARYEEREADGRVMLRASFHAFADVHGVRLPTKLSLETPTAGRRVDIELDEPEVNPELADRLFALETIRGTKEVDLDQILN